MNTYDVKEKLGFFYYMKLVLCGFAIYYAFKKDNSLFQSIINGMYLSSGLTLLGLLYRRIQNVVGAIVIFIAAFIAFVELPLPGIIVGIMMQFMMFFGTVYDCFQWVRLAEIKYDEKHGNKEKWIELEKMVNQTKHYSAKEKSIGYSISAARQKHLEGNKLAVRMNKYINLSEQIWEKLKRYTYKEEVYALYREYNAVISESSSIRQYFGFADAHSIDWVEESNKYETMREYFNRFQRIRKRLDELQRQYLGTGTVTSDSKVSVNTANYFKGCDSLESLHRRYRELSRIFHPDSANGSAEVFAEIQATYETMKKKYVNK